VRTESEKKLPAGCTAIARNALNSDTYADQIAPSGTFLQLGAVGHSSPAQAVEFRSIDLPAGLGAIIAARNAGVRHFMYVSVAHPAPMIHASIAVRAECEAAIESAVPNATVLRPWNVLGPGHRVALSVGAGLPSFAE
jgi:uncharacterized protein YbjT (DUF2867 family)